MIDINDIKYDKEKGIVTIESDNPRMTYIELSNLIENEKDILNIKDDSMIHPGTNMYRCVSIGKDVVIHCNTVIGGVSVGFERKEDGSMILAKQTGTVKIGDNVRIGSHVTINRSTNSSDKTIIEDNVVIADKCHIGHNVKIRKNAAILGGSILAGGAEIGEGSTIGAGAIIMNKKKIGRNCLIGSGSIVTKDVPDNECWIGQPAKFLRKTIRGM